MPVEPGMARRRSSSRNSEGGDGGGGGPTDLGGGGIGWQVRNWLDATEARRLKRSIEHRCRVISREEEGECRTARYGLQCCTARMGSCTVLRGTGS